MRRTGRHLSLLLAFAVLFSLAAPSALASAGDEPESLLGATEGNVYTNGSFGLIFSAPEDWELESEQDLLAAMGMDASAFDAVAQEDIAAYLAENDTAFVMSASSADGLETANIQLMDTGGMGRYLSEQDMIELTIPAMDLGIEGAVTEQNTFSFCGEDHPGISVRYTDTSLGVDMDMYIEVVVLMQEDYLLMVTMGSAFENTLDEVAVLFSPLRFSGSVFTVRPGASAGSDSLLGATEGNVYTNGSFGLTFSAPEDWELDSEQDLLAAMGMDASAFDAVAQEDIAAYLAENDTAFVMSASSADGLETANVQLMDTGGMGRYLSEQDMIELTIPAMDLGIEGAVTEQNTFSFCGEDHPGIAVRYTDTSLGIDMDMYVEVVVLVQEDYLLMITMGSAFENTLDEVAALFTASA